MLWTLPALFTITLFTSASALQPRDVSPDDSITYCAAEDKGNDEQYYIPCTKTSNPFSEVLFWFPYFTNVTTESRFAAHFECYVETGLG